MVVKTEERATLKEQQLEVFTTTTVPDTIQSVFNACDGDALNSIKIY